MCTAKWQENGFELYKKCSCCCTDVPNTVPGDNETAAELQVSWTSAREAMQADGVAI